MKNLSELSEEQKSVMLAKVMGWEPTPEPAPDVPLLVMFKTNNGVPLYSTSVLCQMSLDNFWERHMPNLYDTQHMSLAWRVLNWASSNKSPHPEEHDEMQYKMQEWLTYHVGWLDILPPAAAQSAWLDKILSLAIEAGMVEVQNAND